MADNNFTVEYSFSTLVDQVAGLKTHVAVQTVIGTAAITAGVAVAWFLISSVMETNRALGKLEAGESVVELLKEIKESINNPTAPMEKKSEQGSSRKQKQGALENMPEMMGGWIGIKAESSNRLGQALAKSPAKGPVWVYTDDPSEAAKIKSMIDAQ